MKKGEGKNDVICLRAALRYRKLDMRALGEKGREEVWSANEVAHGEGEERCDSGDDFAYITAAGFTLPRMALG